MSKSKAEPPPVPETMTGWCHCWTGEMHYFLEGEERTMCGLGLTPQSEFTPATFTPATPSGSGREYARAHAAPHCPSCKKLHIQYWLNRGKK